MVLTTFAKKVLELLAGKEKMASFTTSGTDTCSGLCGR
jgi:hypothetical protein